MVIDLPFTCLGGPCDLKVFDKLLQKNIQPFVEPFLAAEYQKATPIVQHRKSECARFYGKMRLFDSRGNPFRACVVRNEQKSLPGTCLGLLAN